MGVGVVGIKLDRPAKRAKSLGVGFSVRPVMQDLAGQHVLVGRHVRGGLPLDPIVPRSLDAAKEGRRDGRGDLVLDGEDVLELAIVALGPDMGFGLAVDELDGDPDPIARLAYASFGDVVHPELARDLLGLDGLALVDEHGVAGDH